MEKEHTLILIICLSIIVTAFAGCIESSFKKTDTVLTKLDGTEHVQWINVIENYDYATTQSLAPRFNQFIQTSDNGFLIAGFFFNRSGLQNLRILKTDKKGNFAWEKRITDQTGEILTIIQRDDNGYMVFLRDGRVHTFNASGITEKILNLPEQIPHTPGGKYSDVTTHSVTLTKDGDLTVIMTGGDYNDLQQPVVIVGLSQNGTVSWAEKKDVKNIGGTTSIIQTQDGGFLIGKTVYSDSRGKGGQILVEKTDPDFSVAWDSTVGLCNYTFCYNDLLGMHESDLGYDIIYESHEQSNATAGNSPEIIYAQLDTNGHMKRQDLLTNILELPSWFFYQYGSSPEFTSLIKRSVMDSLVTKNRYGNPTVRFVTLLKTDDGGYALVGTRYYPGWDQELSSWMRSFLEHEVSIKPEI